MRPRNIYKFKANANDVMRSYNLALKRKKTKTQWIIRSLIVGAVLIFSSGFILEFSNLTGLKSSATVVSAQEQPKQFNPVKLLMSDEGAKKMTEADYILVQNLMRVRLSIKQMQECAVHGTETAVYGMTKEEVGRVLIELETMEKRIYSRVEERWSNEARDE